VLEVTNRILVLEAAAILAIRSRSPPASFGAWSTVEVPVLGNVAGTLGCDTHARGTA
jgi:hypothetical protein